ncbi:MAG: hypothetical protein H6839_02045 [Planctomycetes bacterium]|nr:hypothetical protein [Planctomycetota bacterium]
MRKLLRPGVQPANEPGRRAPVRSAAGAKAKVKRLLEAMVDAAYEDLASGVEKPRVSYGQALRAGELLVRYEEAEEAEPAEEPAEDAEEQIELIEEAWLPPAADEPAPQPGEEVVEPSTRTG